MQFNQSLKETEMGWYYQLAAQFEYYHDKVESNNLQIKAIEASSKMFVPLVPYKYKQKNSNRTQAANMVNYINKFTRYQDLVFSVKETLSSLSYSPDISFKKFEKALVEIGRFLGFVSTSPELEKGNGPDALWALQNNIFLILEAKSMATHQKISRDNIHQLLGSVEWFKQNYPDKDFLAVTLQKTSVLEKNVNISDKTRCLEENKLSALKHNIDQFIIALHSRYGLAALTHEKIDILLTEYKLTSNQIISQYLITPQQEKQ